LKTVVRPEMFRLTLTWLPRNRPPFTLAVSLAPGLAVNPDEQRNLKRPLTGKFF
jgi:hypothetical protein